MGLDGVIVRELVKNEYSQEKILGSVFILQLLGGFLSLVLAITLTKIIRPDDILVQTMVAIIGACFVFKSVEVIKYQYEAKLQSRYIVSIENAVFLIFVLVKISLILLQAPVIYFALLVLGEAILVAVGFLILYTKRNGSISNWKANYRCIRILIKSGWPLILSGSFVLINMNFDRILLGEFSGENSVGLYSVALSLIGAFYFFSLIIGASVVPGLTKLYLSNKDLYFKKRNEIYIISIYVNAVLAFALSIFSNIIISTLYGEEYKNSSSILAIGSVSLVFVSQISLRGRFLIIEGREFYLALFVFLGAIFNVSANFVLIPSYGAVGAAFAYTTSWAASAVVFPVLFKATRSHGLAIFRSTRLFAD
jgi:PST family polysaccharide transporter